MRTDHVARRTALLTLLLAAPACATPAAAQAPTPAAETANLFVVLYRPGPAWRTGQPMSAQLGPHGAYMRQLFDDGRLFAGGGYASNDGGMAMIRAADIAEARAILAADPAITGGVFEADLKHWRPRFRSESPIPPPPRA